MSRESAVRKWVIIYETKYQHHSKSIKYTVHMVNDSEEIKEFFWNFF